ncbi:MAG: rhodanese-like domain-containing protein [Acidobacteriota bacterium]|nr:rhodanese-like domain-containing protein [Acidobacteriota bacterium]
MLRYVLGGLFVAAMFGFAGGMVHVSIPAVKFDKKMDVEKGTLLDVRTPKEYAAGHVKGSKLVNYFDEDFKKKLAEMPKDTTYYVYCRSGGRSGKTLKMMKDMGFQRVYDMSDGMLGWERAGLPVEKVE